MASWTTPGDVVDAWIGEGAPDNPTKIQVWIDKAEREIRYRVPDIQERIDAESGTDLLDAARDVAVAMVIRVFRNPEGIRQTNVTTGPFTNSRTYGGEVPGGLVPTDDELAKLQGEKSGGAFTINMIPSTSPYYCED